MRFPAGTLLLLEVSFAASHAQEGDPRVRHLLQGPATAEAIRGRHGFTLATTPIELPEGPWPRAASSTTDNQCVRALDPDSSGARILLNQGQWTVEAGTGDLAATAPGLLPFVVHEAKCAQPKQRDPAARKRANEACIAAPWGLIGYFLDPVLYELLARTARLSLPGRALPRTSVAGSYHAQFSRSMCTMSCVWGTLRPPWSGAACSIPLQQGSPLLGASRSSRFLCPMICRHQTWLHPPSGLWALLSLHAESPLAAIPDLPGLWEALPSGSQSAGWLASCRSEVPEQLVEWL